MLLWPVQLRDNPQLGMRLRWCTQWVSWCPLQWLLLLVWMLVLPLGRCLPLLQLLWGAVLSQHRHGNIALATDCQHQALCDTDPLCVECL